MRVCFQKAMEVRGRQPKVVANTADILTRILHGVCVQKSVAAPLRGSVAAQVAERMTFCIRKNLAKEVGAGGGARQIRLVSVPRLRLVSAARLLSASAGRLEAAASQRPRRLAALGARAKAKARGRARMPRRRQARPLSHQPRRGEGAPR